MKKILQKLFGDSGDWLSLRELFRYVRGHSPYRPRFSLLESNWKKCFIIWTGPAPREIDLRAFVSTGTPPPFWINHPHPDRNKLIDVTESTEEALDRLRAEQESNI